MTAELASIVAHPLPTGEGHNRGYTTSREEERRLLEHNRAVLVARGLDPTVIDVILHPSGEKSRPAPRAPGKPPPPLEPVLCKWCESAMTRPGKRTCGTSSCATAARSDGVRKAFARRRAEKLAAQAAQDVV